MIGFKILQVRLEHPEKKIDIVSWLRILKSASRTGICRCRDRFIVARIRERERQAVSSARPVIKLLNRSAAVRENVAR